MAKILGPKAFRSAELSVPVRLECGPPSSGVLRARPPARPERLLAPFASHPPRWAIPGHFGIREDSFNQLNQKTGPQYSKVDADTGEEVANEDIVNKGDTDTFIEVAWKSWRYPYEIRDPAEYFDNIQDVKVTPAAPAGSPTAVPANRNASAGRAFDGLPADRLVMVSVLPSSRSNR
jgi:hypothetical protein